MALPATSEEILDWSWDDYAPHYESLATTELDEDGISDWLQRWSDLVELLSEVGTRMHIATTVDTTDEIARDTYHKFLEGVGEPAQAAEQQLKERLLASGLEPEGFTVQLRAIRAEAELFCEANLPLFTESKKLANRYDEIIGAQSIEWDGEEKTLTQLQPVMLETDRERREAVWRLVAERRLADRDTINNIWRELLEVRCRIAANADCADFREFCWKALQRFDYSPDDCLEFHDAIADVALPAAGRLLEQRRELLSVGNLRPWDLAVDTQGRDPLAPFDNIAELEAGCERIFNAVAPELGASFSTMREGGLLDLGNRKGKAPGGYCTEYHRQRLPFIFMNAVGVHGDVQTLLHEGGHAFHVFESAQLPYAMQREVGMEFAEVASMAMELLAAPYLAKSEGGFYSTEEAARARCEHLERSLLFWPYMAVVDGFQHWAYTHPKAAAQPAKCDEAWRELWLQFHPHLDWGEFDDYIETGWHNKLHLYHVPFYYVEYGMAQLGSVQVWSNALHNQEQAVTDYRRALALGATVTLPELYATAGGRFAFDAETLGNAVSLIERTLGELAT
ncbi:MAG: M3 family oligoendopeptidase [Candidatus Poseidoniia archaeon]|jgi:oligoendopeptidase F|nr:M3 family oligoendopeptidase [Candidatus Poseidoniia archaeon]MDP7082152.1 M3 family oligoendopeptidase [Candidatus Poseidoniia archaeon]MDP7473468.1 M3 family oligoendopeptidase [Candidatus Poseidoniia archaeon]|tara:strand:+ start:16570 stop:18264 length:1695 start_codon:yes stop_codon:yes gene_type:complete